MKESSISSSNKESWGNADGQDENINDSREGNPKVEDKGNDKD